MKRVRYRITGLFGLAAVVAIGFSWVGWPERAALNFVDEHYRQQIEVQNPFREGTTEFSAFEERSRLRLVRQKRQRIAKLRLVPHDRSLMDVLAGRRTFDFGMVEFTICRGSVVSGPTPFFDSVVRYDR